MRKELKNFLEWSKKNNSIKKDAATRCRNAIKKLKELNDKINSKI
jgi:hypothetical protein